MVSIDAAKNRYAGKAGFVEKDAARKLPAGKGRRRQEKAALAPAAAAGMLSDMLLKTALAALEPSPLRKKWQALVGLPLIDGPLYTAKFAASYLWLRLRDLAAARFEDLTHHKATVSL